MVSAGDLRCRITPYQRTEVQTEYGEVDYTYSPAPPIWARIMPVSASSQRLAADSERPAITHRAIIRERAWPNLTADCYFIYQKQRYDITAYMPVYNQPGLTELRCVMLPETVSDLNTGGA